MLFQYFSEWWFFASFKNMQTDQYLVSANYDEKHQGISAPRESYQLAEMAKSVKVNREQVRNWKSNIVLIIYTLYGNTLSL